MGNKFCILGYGINGMIASSIIHKYVLNSEILIISPDIGGEFSVGGLKVIEPSCWVGRYMNDVLLMPYQFRLVHSYIWCNNKMHKYPDDVTYEIQQLHWNKTRMTGVGDFDPTCMNDCWNRIGKDNLICIDDKNENVAYSFFSSIEKYSKRLIGYHDIQLVSKFIDRDDLNYLMDNGYNIISTIPLQILLRLFGIELDSESNKHARNLYIRRYIVPHSRLVHKWDYVYLPDNDSLFHRVSRSMQPHPYEGTYAAIFDFEFYCEDEIDSKIADKLDNDANRLLRDTGAVKDDYHRYGAYKSSMICGHIARKYPDDIIRELPSNIMVIGRHGAGNGRMLVHDVIETLYKQIAVNVF